MQYNLDTQHGKISPYLSKNIQAYTHIYIMVICQKIDGKIFTYMYKSTTYTENLTFYDNGSCTSPLALVCFKAQMQKQLFHVPLLLQKASSSHTVSAKKIARSRSHIYTRYKTTHINDARATKGTKTYRLSVF